MLPQWKQGWHRVSERWENLSELGRLAQMYALSLICPGEMNQDPGEGLWTSMRVWTTSHSLSAEGVGVCVWFCLFPLLDGALHTSVGVRVHITMNLALPLWPSHMRLEWHHPIQFDRLTYRSAFYERWRSTVGGHWTYWTGNYDRNALFPLSIKLIPQICSVKLFISHLCTYQTYDDFCKKKKNGFSCFSVSLIKSVCAASVRRCQ